MLRTVIRTLDTIGSIITTGADFAGYVFFAILAVGAYGLFLVFLIGVLFGALFAD